MVCEYLEDYILLQLKFVLMYLFCGTFMRLSSNIESVESRKFCEAFPR